MDNGVASLILKTTTKQGVPKQMQGAAVTLNMVYS